MKALLRFVRPLLLTLLILKSALIADDVLWQGTGSGAWITGGNWQGGVVPWETDVAQFGNTGPALITLALHHASHNPKGIAHIGAIQLLSARSTNDLTITSNANTSSTLHFYGQTVHGIANTILVNDSSKNLTLNHFTGTNSRSMAIALRENQDHVIQLNGSGNITVNNRIDGANSRLIVRAGAGATGTVTLQGGSLTSPLVSTFSGGTTLINGTLVLAANQAAGTGKIRNQGGVLRINQGVVIDNQIEMASIEAVYQREFQANQSYSSYRAVSSLGSREVDYQILAGESSSERVLISSVQQDVVAVNDTERSSVIVNLQGTESDIYVLQLNIVPADLGAGSYLGWLDNDQWQHAVLGNSMQGDQAVTGFMGSYADSGATAAADYLGSWGYDLDAGAVWAVVDHDGLFAVIPESHAYLYLGGVMILLLGLRRLKKYGVSQTVI